VATAEAKKALRASRKAKGLCIHCGDKAKEKQTRCQRCVDRDKANRKRYAERDTQRGICRNTGCSNKVTGKKRYCDACNARSTRNGAKREQANLARGMCRDCGKQPCAVGITRCAACNEKLAIAQQRLADKRKAEHRCTRCGANVLTSGRTHCNKCIDEARERHNARKRRVMETYGGPVCVGCGEDEIRILQLDHVNKIGHQHALEIGDGDAPRGRSKMYKWVEDNHFPPGFQVLCPNCNIKKARGIPLPLTR
jgi:hypothetical protein